MGMAEKPRSAFDQAEHERLLAVSDPSQYRVGLKWGNRLITELSDAELDEALAWVDALKQPEDFRLALHIERYGGNARHDNCKHPLDCRHKQYGCTPGERDPSHDLCNAPYEYP